MNFLKNLFHREPKKQREELFSTVIGYDDIKEVLSLSLQSREPVNILLSGPPASSKTLFLLDILNHHKDKAYFIDGARTTKVGIFDLCFQMRPKILVIDEIDGLPRKDQKALLNLMETGILSVTVHKKIQTTQLKCWIYATLNDPSKLIAPLKSRFQMLHLPEYTKDQFIEIGTQLLQRKGIDYATSNIITRIVYEQMDTKDPRQVIRLGNMMSSIDSQEIDMNKLKRVISTCIKYGTPT